MLGKSTFYPLVKEALESMGYHFYGESMIRGKGRGHARKPDYIAKKGGIVIIGEIKSPSEPPTSTSWRQVQPNDSEEFKKVRLEISKLEQSGKMDKNIGGHLIIIKGQIPDYFRNIGITFEMPFDIKGARLMSGYSVESSQSSDVSKALGLCGLSFDKIDTGNGSVSFIFKGW